MRQKWLLLGVLALLSVGGCKKSIDEHDAAWYADHPEIGKQKLAEKCGNVGRDEEDRRRDCQAAFQGVQNSILRKPLPRP